MAICPKRDASYSVNLTEDEIYTLQILLAYVGGDDQACSVGSKLAHLMGDVEEEDYNAVMFNDEGDGHTSISIQQ